MPQGTTTSTDQMGVFQTQCTDAATRISGMLTTLLNQLQGLEANWLGRGGTSFGATKLTVQNEVTRLHGALTGMAADVGTASVNYANADTEQGSSMDSVNSQTTGITTALSV